MDVNGALVRILRSDPRTLELEKAKAGILAGSQERLAADLETLIAAGRAFSVHMGAGWM